MKVGAEISETKNTDLVTPQMAYFKGKNCTYFDGFLFFWHSCSLIKRRKIKKQFPKTIL
jgi:hypothetical protein